MNCLASRISPATLVVAALAAFVSGTETRAQSDPGLPNSGRAVHVERDSAAGRIVSTVHEDRFSYVRIESREPGAPLNQHPVAVDAAALRALLARIQAPGGRDESLLSSAELDQLAAPLAKALARATPEQDVSFAVSGRHGVLGLLASRAVTTARVFFADDRLNLIFGLVRRDFESQFRATGYLIAFEPGKRAGPVDRHVQVSVGSGGTTRRADWVALDPRAAPAPVAAPSAPALPPAVVIPSPAPVAPAAPVPAATAVPSPAPPPPPAGTPAAAPQEADALFRQASERLKALQKLRDSGLITEQEFQEKRREILKQL